MKILTPIIISFFFNIVCLSQGWKPMGTRASSLSNTSVTLVDVWAYHNNPGALSNIKKTTFGISYENRFLLKETQLQGFCLAQPLKIGTLSLGGQYYGNDNLKSYRVGFGYSLKLTEFLSAGVQFNSQGLRLPSYYGSKNSLSAEIGILATITENWTLGCSVFNLGNSKLADYQNERNPTTMRLGSAYKISKMVQFFLEFDKNIFLPIQLKAAFEYNPKEEFFFRFGCSTEPYQLAFGAGYHFKKMNLNLGSSYQQILGWSPSFTMNFELNKKNENK